MAITCAGGADVASRSFRILMLWPTVVRADRVLK